MSQFWSRARIVSFMSFCLSSFRLIERSSSGSNLTYVFLLARELLAPSSRYGAPLPGSLIDDLRACLFASWWL